MWYGGQRLACLALALLLAGVLAYMLGPVAIDRCVESFSGGEVIISYVRGPNPLTGNLPVIQVADASGNSVDALVINVFAIMPHTNVRYLGAVGSDGDAVIVLHDIVSKLNNEVIPAWGNELKHLGGFEASLLLFIDVIRELSNGTYAAYPQVKAVPLNLQLLSKGYRLNSITIKINTSAIKPSIIALNTTTPHIKSASLNITNQGCVVLHNGSGNLVYCAEWKLQRECAHLENTLIPVIVLRIPRGRFTDPQRIFEVQSFLILEGVSPTRLGMHAGIRLSNAPQDSYESIEVFTNFSFTYMSSFFNRRWTSERVQFTDDAIIVVGFKGSIALDSFRKYDALCKGSELRCPEGKYSPTDTIANITLTTINVTYDGLRWVVALGYDIDDTVGDGKGWDRYWSLAKEHARLGGTSAGVGEATYFYRGNANNENYVGIDVADLVTMITGNHELSSYFPIDAGIGFGSKDTSAQIVNVHVRNENQYSDYYVCIDSYVSRDEVYIDGTYTHLKLMLFDVEDYPPS